MMWRDFLLGNISILAIKHLFGKVNHEIVDRPKSDGHCSVSSAAGGNMRENLDKIIGHEAANLLRTALGNSPLRGTESKLLTARIRRQLAYSMYNTAAQCATHGEERQLILSALKLQIDRELRKSKQAGLL